MTDTTLPKELIDDASKYSLCLTIRKGAVDVSVSPRQPDLPTLTTTIQLTDALSALESAVYDNPLLLSDFNDTTVLVETGKFLLVPASMCGSAIPDLIASSIWGSDTISFSEPVGTGREIMVSGISREIMAFLRRTFPTACVRQRIALLVDRFVVANTDRQTAKLYVNDNSESIDVVYAGQYALHAVNTYFTPTIDDKMYYIMALTSTCGFRPHADEIMLYGNDEAVGTLAAALGEYFSIVKCNADFNAE